jgi:hypothetical protein
MVLIFIQAFQLLTVFSGKRVITPERVEEVETIAARQGILSRTA